MKRNMRWLMGALLICELWMFVACVKDDIPAVVPDSEQLQDGEWTGSGEGRSGTIIVKVTVENHQVTKVTVVSQSESTFAQEAINSICESAVGRTAEMSVEVDGITGATLTSTGVIDAINMALQAAMGMPVDKGKTYQDGTCDIVVIGAGGAGLLKEGNTVAELAKATSIPAADLEATLKRYNAQQKAGVDDDFGRSAAQLTAALETAPYYAVCVTPAIHHTMGGLSVNTSTQVLKADGTPIPGLYAAGEVTGGLHGANRLGGNGVADIVVNGRLAGIAAARMFARLDS